MEKRNPMETNAAEEYGKSIKALEETDEVKKNEKTQNLRREVKALEMESSLRWKEDRKLYPKARSRVGAEYQVESFPSALSTGDENDMESITYVIL
jgi:hypothetical protein